MNKSSRPRKWIGGGLYMAIAGSLFLSIVAVFFLFFDSYYDPLWIMQIHRIVTILSVAACLFGAMFILFYNKRYGVHFFTIGLLGHIFFNLWMLSLPHETDYWHTVNEPNLFMLTFSCVLLIPFIYTPLSTYLCLDAGN